MPDADPPPPGTPGQPTDQPTLRSLLRRRSPMLFLLSATAATTAAAAQATALGVQVFDLTGSELDLGLLGLAEFLPAVALVLVTGALADRFDRRVVLGSALLAEAACFAALARLAATGVRTVAPLLAVVVAFGVCRAVAAPAGRALPATLVEPAALPRIVPLFAASWQVGLIAGPVLGGVLYAVDPALPYAVGAALVLVAAACVAGVRLHPEAVAAAGRAERPGWRDALDGLRLIRRTPVLLGAISLDLFAVLFGGAVVLLPAIAEDRLGVGPAGLGWLRAAGGIGAALTTLVLIGRPPARRIGRILLAAVAVFGAATVLLGVTTSFAVAFAALFVLSGADAISVWIRSTLVPLITPDDHRGRVLAVEQVFIGASNELGAFQSGVAGALLGAPGAIVLGGAVTLAVVVGWWFSFPALRDVDRFADLDPADTG